MPGLHRQRPGVPGPPTSSRPFNPPQLAPGPPGPGRGTDESTRSDRGRIPRTAAESPGDPDLTSGPRPSPQLLHVPLDPSLTPLPAADPASPSERRPCFLHCRGRPSHTPGRPAPRPRLLLLRRPRPHKQHHYFFVAFARRWSRPGHRPAGRARPAGRRPSARSSRAPSPSDPAA